MLLHPDAISSSSSSSSAAASALPMPAASSNAGASAPAGGGGGPNPNASFYQLAYYQHHFDVTSVQVRDRLLRALLPLRWGKFYAQTDDGLGNVHSERADLYGPFWIATTLIFLLAAAGNFANYLQFITAAGNGPHEETTAAGTNTTGSGSGGGSAIVAQVGVWTYDFQKVTIGASVFYAWITLVPLAVYCALSRAGGSAPASAEAGVPHHKGMAEIASLFGYSLATMLPVCVLCIPAVSLLRWTAVGVSFVLSSFFLLTNLGTADVHNQALLPISLAILVLNFAIAMLTKFYFFEF